MINNIQIGDNYNTADVKIGDKWVTQDYGLFFTKKEISPPEIKSHIIDIQGTSEALDLTEVTSGDVEYKQRIITLTLTCADGKDNYYNKLSELSNDLHGQRKTIIFNRDPSFYWIGRIAVTSAESTFHGPIIVITATVDPYKYERFSSIEEWEWDDFSFDDGIIREYTITAPGSITVIGRRKRVCPTFICSGAMVMTYLGNSYNLQSGSNLIPDIFIGAGDHVFTFIGTGTVSIDYVGGSL